MFTLIQIRPGEKYSEMSRVPQDKAPRFEQLQKFVGGILQFVPQFKKFEGKLAVAFCHDEGKMMSLPYNELATMLWAREMGLKPGDQLHDVLVGNIVIVQCDTEDEFHQL